MKTKFYLAIILIAGFFTSCITDEVFVGPPSITGITVNPLAPKASDNVVISATVIDTKGLSSVKLFYRVGTSGTFTELTMAATGDVYSATIPAQVVTSQVFYYIQAININLKTSYAPSNAPTSTSTYTVGAAVNPIILNEVCGLAVPDNDWIELYNLSSAEVDISGFTIQKTDELGAISTICTIPALTKIAATSYLLIHKTAVAPETIVISAGISNTKNLKLELKNALGVTLSSFEKTASVPNATGHLAGGSYARIPNGTGDWTVVTTATPGAANVSN
jgi:hypothetical protein